MDAHAPKELKEMHRLVCTLFIRPEGAAFRAPVDWKTMGLIDYPQIVKNPMDLGTIKANLESGKYKTKEEVAADIRLVWTNCMLYNHDGSEVGNSIVGLFLLIQNHNRLHIIRHLVLSSG
jgi:hypothetical protein